MILVGTGWCWLVLVGAGWCWLVPVGAGWCRLVPVGAIQLAGARTCKPGDHSTDIDNFLIVMMFLYSEAVFFLQLRYQAMNTDQMEGWVLFFVTAPHTNERMTTTNKTAKQENTRRVAWEEGSEAAM